MESFSAKQYELIEKLLEDLAESQDQIRTLVVIVEDHERAVESRFASVVPEATTNVVGIVELAKFQFLSEGTWPVESDD